MLGLDNALALLFLWNNQKKFFLKKIDIKKCWFSNISKSWRQIFLNFSSKHLRKVFSIRKNLVWTLTFFSTWRLFKPPVNTRDTERGRNLRSKSTMTKAEAGSDALLLDASQERIVLTSLRRNRDSDTALATVPLAKTLKLLSHNSPLRYQTTRAGGLPAINGHWRRLFLR